MTNLIMAHFEIEEGVGPPWGPVQPRTGSGGDRVPYMRRLHDDSIQQIIGRLPCHLVGVAMPKSKDHLISGDCV